jgi:biopolymer transport protein ExbD
MEGYSEPAAERKPRPGIADRHSKIASPMRVSPQRTVPMLRPMIRSPQPRFAAINVAPMSGIMLVLVLAAAREVPLIGRTEDIRIPEVSADWPDLPGDGLGDDKVTITTMLDGTLFVNGRRIGTEDEVTERIVAHFRRHSSTERIVYLKADVQAPFEIIQRVLDACTRAGIGRVRLVAETRPPG